MSDDAPLATVERWEAHGGTLRVVLLSERLAVVELCTCHGEPVDTLRSSDPALLQYLAPRGADSGLAPSVGSSRARTSDPGRC